MYMMGGGKSLFSTKLLEPVNASPDAVDRRSAKRKTDVILT